PRAIVSASLPAPAALPASLSFTPPRSPDLGVGGAVLQPVRSEGDDTTGVGHPVAGGDARVDPRGRQGAPLREHRAGPVPGPAVQDRKSTRLNSSHVSISYAVFCLKKKRPRPHGKIPPTTRWSPTPRHLQARTSAARSPRGASRRCAATRRYRRKGTPPSCT